MIRRYAPLAVAIVLAACGRGPADEAAEGAAEQAANDESIEVGFELVRAQEGEGRFRLVNQGSHAISFRGSQVSSEGVEPLDAQLKCKTAGSEVWDEGPRPMGDRAGSRRTLRRWRVPRRVASAGRIDRRVQ